MDRIASAVSAFAILAVSGLAFGQVNDMPALGEETAPADRSGWLALGDALFTPVDIDALTLDTGNLGVEHAWGYYWVTHNGGFVTGTQVLVQFDEDFNVVAEYTQLTNSPAWGHRDGASIESENLLFFGAEAGEVTEYRFNPTTQRLDMGASRILQFDTSAVVRALAWDPTRNQFYSKDFGGVINIFDRDGAIINFAASTASAYGAAYDSVHDTVWLYAYIDTALGTTAPNTRMVEWNPATLTATGRQFDAVGSTPPGVTYHIPGGLDIRTEGGCTYAVAMNQGGIGTTISLDFISFWELAGECGGTGCRVDLDGDGELTIFDFLTFSNLFDTGDLAADFDGDGSLTIFDFLTFSNEFDAGC